MNKLALMKDKERLDTLKEVAGTRVYEERRKESMQIMKETRSKQEKINEVIEYVEQRLKELEEEKAELVDYQATDKTKRCLEYKIYSMDLENAKEQLKKLEIAEATYIENSQLLRTNALELHQKIREMEDDILARLTELSGLNLDLSRESSEHKVLVTHQRKLDFEAGELREKMKADEDSRKENMNKLNKLRKNIHQAEEELNSSVLPEFEEKQQEVQDFESNLKKNQSRVDALYEKQGWTTRFKSKAERNAHIQEQIEQTSTGVQQTQKSAEILRAEVERLDQTLKKDEKNVQSVEGKSRDTDSKVKDAQKQMEDLENQKEGLTEERKRKWKTADDAVKLHKLCYDVRNCILESA